MKILNLSNIESGTQPKYVRCNYCFHVEKAVPGVNYPQNGDGNQCSVCRTGYLNCISLETTPEKVELSREELEADRQRNRHRDAVMLRDPGCRNVLSFDERLRIGFNLMEGRYDDS